MARIQDTKHRLLDAARKLIWESSYGATSVEAICDLAGVNKGSFYHFFSSKSELAVCSLEEEWQKCRAEIAEIFDSQIPPLQRLVGYFERVYHRQVELKQSSGRVLGCPLCSLGSETCNQDKAIRSKVQEIFGHYRNFFLTAVRDAAASGEVPPGDIELKARVLFAYVQGTLVQARIENDAEVLSELARGTAEILAIKPGVLEYREEVPA